MSDARAEALRLIRSANVGPVTYRQLVARFGTPAAAIEALATTMRFVTGTLDSDGRATINTGNASFPQGTMKSSRRTTYQVVEVVEAPDPTTVRFRLKWPESSFLLNLASPWNWIYKADILAKDPVWIPIYNTKEIIVTRAAVKGFTIHPVEYNLELWKAWLDR